MIYAFACWLAITLHTFGVSVDDYRFWIVVVPAGIFFIHLEKRAE